MESSISSLSFKGSIGEAVFQAQTLKKLFLVYVSGEDEQSALLDSSTWMDKNVLESISKYCIFLRLSQGSTDAAHFSAIYPQKSVPCITAVGYNGVLLWQNEGFVSAEVVASTLEKAWLSLHIQETAATFISAAIASKNSEPSTTSSDTYHTVSMGEASSSMDIPSPLIDKVIQSSEDKPPATSEIVEEDKGCAHRDEDIEAKHDAVASSKLSYSDDLVCSKDEQSASTAKTQRRSVSPGKVNVDNSGVGHSSLTVNERCPTPQKDKGPYLGISKGASQVVISESAPKNKTEVVEEKKDDSLDVATSKSNEVHLNIRLPNGSTLREKFDVTSALRVVKGLVDQSQDSSGIGSYDLAIPYPRKVFNNQDLSRSLYELGLTNRQALVVVPHHLASGHQKGVSSSRDQSNATHASDSLGGSDGGYFAYARSILSFINPFSYLGGSTSSSSSGPNTAPQNSQGQGTERPAYTRYSPNQTISDRSKNDRKSSVPSTSRIGSNIHTLRRDENEDQFDDRNAYWNGNSTQYGGDNDGK